ncbi:TspO/MBR family protein [uncultured Hyphomonas sp.]|uniref:TspO/MBR family protein n=1 Tax=uncultured Hyphomonas sp. TaxID=225298 RepID=UPI002AAC0038|nr:TspO/MBR family protein [uncultured Hyphomonas sp.]
MVDDSRAPPWGASLVLVLATAMAGAMGGIVTRSDKEPWYSSLEKSSLTPPDWAFGIVWPGLFSLMALSALMVLWRTGSTSAASRALGIYFAMLMVNVGWSLFFFGLKQVPLSLGVLIALWLLILAMMGEFACISKPAAWLQLPYLVWVTFAGYLNLYIWSANPTG